jgi:hypothetical protein
MVIGRIQVGQRSCQVNDVLANARPAVIDQPGVNPYSHPHMVLSLMAL